MKSAKYIPLLFAVIILEGYVVLSAELLAIRQTIPFIGSGTDTVSIIIAAVLMPLAFGYYAGGKFKPGFHNGRYKTVRKKLINNIVIALGFFLIGISYTPLHFMFDLAIKWGINHRLFLTSLYSAVFLVIPVFLLGQTIPLVSNYFSKERLAQITGKILFFSTMGSFMGAVFSTLILMSLVGVNNTAIVAFSILAFLVIILSKKKLSLLPLVATMIASIGFYINSDAAMHTNHNIIAMNNYNTIEIRDNDYARHLILNNNPSSKYTQDGEKFVYIEFTEFIALDPIFYSSPAKDILVIGAGAFTFGIEDETNNYDFVDIDGDLKKIAEDHILKQPLPENKIFYPLPARAFLSQTEKKYDLILLDTYYGRFTLPEHLATQEFFQQIKTHLKDDGVVLANFITSPNFSNPFSRNIDTTFRSVFPYVSRHVIKERYEPWNNEAHTLANVIYMYRKHANLSDAPLTIYTDVKNRAALDLPARQK